MGAVVLCSAPRPFVDVLGVKVTKNVHTYEQNARTKDTYPHGNATYRLSTWYNVCSIMVLSLYIALWLFVLFILPPMLPKWHCHLPNTSLLYIPTFML